MTTEPLADAGHGSTPHASEQALTNSDSGGSAFDPLQAPAPKKEGISGAFERAKAATQTQADGQTPPAGQQAQDGTEPATEEKPAAKPALSPPSRWTREQQEMFAKQPREIQEAWIAQHKNWESGFNKKFEETAGERKFAQEVNAVIPEHIRSVMTERNIPPAQAIGRLFQRYDFSEKQPEQFIAEFIAAKNIDPRIFLPKDGTAGQTNQHPPQPQFDPAQHLAPHIQPLLQKIAQLEQGQSAWQAHQQAERDRANDAAIATFAGETDATGAPKHPHLQRVVDRMADLIENDPRYAEMDPRARLEEAYHVAVLSDPTIREELFSAEAAKRAEALEKQRLTSRLANSATARPAATPQIPSQTNGKKGLRGAFDQARRQVGAG